MYNLQPGVTEADVSRLLRAATVQSSIYSGAGNKDAVYQTALSKIDRFGYNPVLMNMEKSGLTFITRPELNLTTSSIRQHSILATLDTLEPNSLQYTIRCLLDTTFARRADNKARSETAPFLNNELPFITPLTNCLQSISGWPDMVLDTETTEGGFFSEDQTFVKGSDFNNRSYDFSLTFRDIQGGFIMSLFLYWIYWMALAARGTVIPYPETISDRNLCYTCSIYRFVLDPSLKTITKWSKATGCFPKSVPIGNSFNINEKEHFLSSNIQFTIPFQVNHVEYMEPSIFSDFNFLMSDFAGANYWKASDRVSADNIPEHNFKGIPWIDVESGVNELKFICRPEELHSPLLTELEMIKRKVANATRK